MKSTLLLACGILMLFVSFSLAQERKAGDKFIMHKQLVHQYIVQEAFRILRAARSATSCENRESYWR